MSVLVRSNYIYQSYFRLDNRGLLIVSTHWIIATGAYARAWR